MATGIPARLSRREGRKFGLTVGTAFLVLGGVAQWRGHAVLALGLWTLGAGLLLAGLVVPAHLGPVQRGWMGLALAISKVTTPILMGIIYFVVLSSMGLVMRLFGRNALTSHHGGDSAWVPRAAGYQSDLKRQF